MTKGPRELAHREYQDALKARTAAAAQYGINSEPYKAAAARLAMPSVSFQNRRQNGTELMRRKPPAKLNDAESPTRLKDMAKQVGASTHTQDPDPAGKKVVESQR